MDKKDDGYKLPERLKRLRELKGVRQEDVGNYIASAGLKGSKESVRAYESGRNIPNSDVLAVIAEYFNVSADYLLGRENATMRMVDPITGKSRRSPEMGGIRIPVLGRVAAGIPIAAIEEIIDYEEITHKDVEQLREAVESI